MTDRVAIYGRVSTEEQAQNQTIEAQLHACREYCKAKGYEVVEEFLDAGVSGTLSLDDRPEGSRLLAMLKDRGFIDRVVINYLDRLSRDNATGVPAYNKLLTLTEDKVDFVNQSFDNTPEGRLQFNVMIGIAQYEREVIARRFHAGREASVRSGNYIAGPRAPYGYEKIHCTCRPPSPGAKVHCTVADHKTLAINDEQAAIVRKMYEWVARENLGTKRIAQRLTDMGVAPPGHHSRGRRKTQATDRTGLAKGKGSLPKPQTEDMSTDWKWVTVYDILTHPRYTGRALYGKQQVVMTLPTIIDAGTWAKVQGRLQRHRGSAFSQTKRTYLLKGLTYCRECGGRYVAFAERRSDLRPLPGEQVGEVRRYVCGRRQGHTELVHEGKWRWRASELDEQVKNLIREIRRSDAASDSRVESMVEWLDGEYSDMERKLAKLARQRGELIEREKRVLDWGERGTIDESEMIQRRDQIRAERAEVETALVEVRSEAQQAAEWVQKAELVREIWSNLTQGEDEEPDEATWQRLITEGVDRIWVEKDGRVTLEGTLRATSANITSFTCS